MTSNTHNLLLNVPCLVDANEGEAATSDAMIADYQDQLAEIDQLERIAA